MPPKAKEAPKKPAAQIVRPIISDASLVFVPEDAVEGWQDRIETGVDWTLEEEGARYHKSLCAKEDIPKVSFTEALENKMKKSILKGFLDEESSLTLDEQWELMLPIIVWDNEKCANEEGQICFRNINCITEDMIKLIKNAVRAGDRELLKRELKAIHVLRVNDCKMTDLDEGLSQYEKLLSLNLCGNFITEMDSNFIPRRLKCLELQANGIRTIEEFVENLPPELIYLGMARNLLNNESLSGLGRLPHHITVLDLSDNDIYELEPVLRALVRLPSLASLALAGNPCSLCLAYARVTIIRLPKLKWLDFREILNTDRTIEPFEPHPDDFRSTYFYFTVFRIMSVPPPPKTEKGAVSTFHVELEIPLLDAERRRFLMFRRHESLTEMLPVPEDDDWFESKLALDLESKVAVSAADETSAHESDIYANLTAKDSRVICHYTTFESNRMAWNKVMNFQEPSVKIFCPDLTALRDTFRTTITLRLIYTITVTVKPGKPDKKSSHSFKAPPGEHRVTVATIKCALRRLDWSQPSQHFHWDDTFDTNEALHWGDGDLAVLQYTQTAAKAPKGKAEVENLATKQIIPENLTCHFGFGIETIRP